MPSMKVFFVELRVTTVEVARGGWGREDANFYFVTAPDPDYAADWAFVSYREFTDHEIAATATVKVFEPPTAPAAEPEIFDLDASLLTTKTVIWGEEPSTGESK
jgi:hypothetical protein